jgi:hypothetical protein
MAAEVAAALMKQPRSVVALCDHIGVKRQRALVVLGCVGEFRKSGCVYVAGRTRQGANVYAWQPSLFELADRRDLWTTGS